SGRTPKSEETPRIRGVSSWRTIREEVLLLLGLLASRLLLSSRLLRSLLLGLLASRLLLSSRLLRSLLLSSLLSCLPLSHEASYAVRDKNLWVTSPHTQLALLFPFTVERSMRFRENQFTGDRRLLSKTESINIKRIDQRLQKTKVKTNTPLLQRFSHRIS